MRRLFALLLAFLGFIVLLSDALQAQTVIVGTRFGGRIGGLNFRGGDLVQYDTLSGAAEIYLPEATFSSFFGSRGRVAINLDAFSLAPKGDNEESFLFSARVGLVANAETVTRNGVTTFGDTVISQREVVLSDDLQTSNLNILFDNLGTDISGLAVLPNGNLLLAAKTENSFSSLESDGIDYRVGDIVEYDLETGEGSIFFSADNFFTAGEDDGATRAVGNIDAIDVLPNGNLILSTSNNADILGSSGEVFTLRQGGAYEYNFRTGNVSTFFNPIAFGDTAVDLKAFSVVSVPEPTHCCLLLGLLGFLGKRRRSN